MTSETRLDRLFDRQADGYRAVAQTRALATLEALAAAGLTAWLVGSLARDRFTVFSDVDFLIDGGYPQWTEAVAIIERHMGDLRVDILQSARLTAPERTHLLKDALDAPSFRARLDQAGIASNRGGKAGGG